VPRSVTPMSDVIVGFRGDDKLLTREHEAL